jgi:hypothetical protein
VTVTAWVKISQSLRMEGCGENAAF